MIVLHSAAASSAEWYLFNSRLGEAVLFLVVGAVLGIVGQYSLDRIRGSIEDHEVWIGALKRSSRSLSSRITSYRVGDKEAKDPYEVQFVLWATGRRDINRDLFDGTDLVIDLGVPILDGMEATEAINAHGVDLRFDGSRIIVSPSVIRRRMVMRWTLLTDGRPSLTWNDSMINVEIRSWFQEWSMPRSTRGAMKTLGWTTLMMIPVAAATLILWAALTSTSFASVAGWILLIVFVFATLGAALLAQSDGPGRTLRRAMRVLHRQVRSALRWSDYEYGSNPMQPRYPPNRVVRSAVWPPGIDTDEGA